MPALEVLDTSVMSLIEELFVLAVFLVNASLTTLRSDVIYQFLFTLVNTCIYLLCFAQ